MKKLLSVSLAVVMIAGSMPLSFGDSLYSQQKKGLGMDDVTCANNSHVLVMRTNGNLACVTEKSADRMNWKIITFQKGIDDVLEQIDGVEEKVPLVISDEKITVTPDTTPTGISGVIGGYASDTQFTYPKEFEAGKPFDLEYSVSYERTYNELTHNYPDDNPNIVAEWEEGEDQIDYWTIREPPIKIWDEKGEFVGHRPTHVSLFVSNEQPVQNLSEDFPIDVLVTEKESKDSVFTNYIPFDNKKVHTGKITLVIDEVVQPHNRITLMVDRLDNRQHLWVYIDDSGKGSIFTEQQKLVFGSEHSAYQQVSGIVTLDSTEPVMYQSPFSEHCTEYLGWDSLSSDERLWHINYFDSCPKEPRVYSNTVPTDKEIADLMYDMFQSVNVTSGYREFFETSYIFQQALEPEDLEKFFEFYPELKGQSITDFNPFSYFLIPNAYASSVGGLVSVRGEVDMDLTSTNNIIPEGYQVCVFDQRNNGDYEVLEHGVKLDTDACHDIGISKDFSFVVKNIDPDNDGSGADMAVGVRSGNDIIHITPFGPFEQVIEDGKIISRTHEAQDPYQYVDTSSKITNVITNSLVFSPFTVPSDDSVTRAYFAFDMLQQGYDHFDDEYNYSVATPLILEWDKDQPAREGVFQYVPGLSLIQIPKEANVHPSAVLHEFGHHVMYSSYGIDNGGSSPNVNPNDEPREEIESCNGHDIHLKTNEGCAYVEGFATYVPIAVIGGSEYETFDYTLFGAESSGLYNFEDRNFRDHEFDLFPVDFADGAEVEGNFATVLYDIRDGVGERESIRDPNRDDISARDSLVWDIIADGTVQNTIEFMDALAEDIDINSVLELNTFPTISEPEPDPQRSKLSTLIFEDEFDDLGEWTNTGDEDWELDRWHSGEGGNPPFTDELLRLVPVSEECDDFCILELKDPINLTRFSNAELFLYYYVDEDVDDEEGLYVDISTNGGTDWITIAEFTEDNNGDTHKWEGTYPELSLSQYLNTANFKVRIVAHSTSGNEDIQIGPLDIYGTKKPSSKPDRVFNVQAPVAEPTFVAISWEKPNDGGSDITSFDIDRRLTPSLSSLDSDSFTTIGTVGGSETSYTDSSVVSGTSYDYQVRAVNNVGNGDYSDPVTVNVPVEDITSPDIFGPADYVTEATAVLTSLTTADYGTATATDNQDSDDQIIISNNSTDLFPLGVTAINHTATDTSGNSNSTIQIINITDTTKPVIEAVNATLEATGPLTQISPPSIIEIFLDSLFSDHPNGLPVGNNFKVTWNANDTSGNNADPTSHFVNVTDSTPPILMLNNSTMNIIGTLGNFTYVEEGATATDSVDGTVNVSISSDVDNYKSGNYTVTYTATDDSGNIANTNRTITINPFTVYESEILFFEDFEDGISNQIWQGDNHLFAPSAEYNNTNAMLVSNFVEFVNPLNITNYNATLTFDMHTVEWTDLHSDVSVNERLIDTSSLNSVSSSSVSSSDLDDDEFEIELQADIEEYEYYGWSCHMYDYGDYSHEVEANQVELVRAYEYYEYSWASWDVQFVSNVPPPPEQSSGGSDLVPRPDCPEFHEYSGNSLTAQSVQSSSLDSIQSVSYNPTWDDQEWFTFSVNVLDLFNDDELNLEFSVYDAEFLIDNIKVETQPIPKQVTEIPRLFPDTLDALAVEIDSSVYYSGQTITATCTTDSVLPEIIEYEWYVEEPYSYEYYYTDDNTLEIDADALQSGTYEMECYAYIDDNEDNAYYSPEPEPFDVVHGPSVGFISDVTLQIADTAPEQYQPVQASCNLSDVKHGYTEADFITSWRIYGSMQPQYENQTRIEIPYDDKNSSYKVMCIAGDGFTSKWSNTVEIDYEKLVNNGISPATNLYPNDLVMSSNPILNWTASVDTDLIDVPYTVVISKSADFANQNIVLDTSVSSVSLDTLSVVVFEEDTRYWWKVITEDKTFNRSTSIVATFWYDTTLPDTHVSSSGLVSPIDGASVPVLPVLEWTVIPDDDLSSHPYVVEVSASSSFDTFEIQSNRQGHLYYVSSNDNLVDGTTYYWRVITEDTLGNTATSETFSFTYDTGSPVGSVTITETESDADSIIIHWTANSYNEKNLKKVDFYLSDSDSNLVAASNLEKTVRGIGKGETASGTVTLSSIDGFDLTLDTEYFIQLSLDIRQTPDDNVFSEIVSITTK